MRYAFPCQLNPEEGGGFWVSFPDVPEALTQGDDRAQARAMALEALTLALGGYMDARRDLPTPSACGPGQELLALPSLVAAKCALYAEMRRQGLSKVKLAERLGLSESAVRKLLDLDHRSHIGQVEAALRSLGRELVLEDRTAA